MRRIGLRIGSRVRGVLSRKGLGAGGLGPWLSAQQVRGRRRRQGGGGAVSRDPVGRGLGAEVVCSRVAGDREPTEGALVADRLVRNGCNCTLCAVNGRGSECEKAALFLKPRVSSGRVDGGLLRSGSREHDGVWSRLEGR